jgi:hypothetical protein
MAATAKDTRTHARSTSKKQTARPRSHKPADEDTDHVETIDLVAEAEKWRESALLVKSLFDADAMPDWLTNLVLSGIERATELTHVEHYAGGHFDLKGMAD